jgi:branched-chain amino acid transport system permease protein
MIAQIANGLTLGLIYGFAALGYALVFGLLGLLNFAHGEIFMLGGVMAYVMMANWHFGLWTTLVADSLLMGLIGLLLWVTCFLPVRRQEDHMAPALSSFAFGLAITTIVIRLWGVDPRAMPLDLGRPSHVIGPVAFSDAHLLVIFATVATLSLLLVVVKHMRIGCALRALAERPRTAALMGIPTRRLIAGTFFVSSALGGLGGALAVLNSGVASPVLGLTIGLKAIAVMVIGGIGNFVGAIVAGLILGFAEVAVVEFATGSFGDAIVWGGLMLVLLVRPTGLLSRHPTM